MFGSLILALLGVVSAQTGGGTIGTGTAAPVVDLAKIQRDFHLAIHRGDTNAAAALLTQGADINDVSASGPQWSPLAEAANNRNTTLCTWLLSKGASPDTPDRRGRTPLYHAVYNGLSTVALEMLKTAKNLSPHDGDGVDLLTRAVEKESVEVVKALLERGVTSQRATDAAQYAPWATIGTLFGLPAPTTGAPAIAPVATPVAAPAAPATVTAAPAVAPAAPATAPAAPATAPAAATPAVPEATEEEETPAAAPTANP
eukprot:CAMPEP_0114656256 /NCGR_PEP_ID=MMETSP0191-20121206/12026_1 /TAXON_ID=126664 /ORGANISM="Sorites sp." /LENGTH=257 /DNA_ID=CAMNT_0001873017 /DNA_START=120 /DNA_END=893 /DNA_ORIENTATION=-